MQIDNLPHSERFYGVHKKKRFSAWPRNARVRMSHRYILAHFSLIVTLKWRVIETRNLFGRFWSLSELIKIFTRKSITKMPTPIFSLDFAKVRIGILVINFQENILMSSDTFQNKFLFNLRRHSTLYDLPFQSYVDKPFYYNTKILFLFVNSSFPHDDQFYSVTRRSVFVKTSTIW